VRVVDDGAIGPGTRIDRYEIVRSVATGGMGHVWLGRLSGKHGFEKLVAIKMVLPELASDAKLRTMLVDEARICSRIEHANVAQILDVGEHAGLPYVVFEWVEGAALCDLFTLAEQEDRRVPLGPLLRVLADVCEGLHAAHELTDDAGHTLGVVHRDVKPANIIVARGGYAKLIDFGVARARDRLAGDTRSGIVKGTPQYMAPEQAQGVKVDRRADVWGVGAVLHHGLRGSAPFEHRVALEAYIRERWVIPPLPEDVPDDVRDIVQRALRRDPAERYPTAAAMGEAIERALRAHGGGSIKDLFPAVPRAPSTPDAATQPEAALGVASTQFAGVRKGERTAAAALSTSRWRITFLIAVGAAVVALGALAWALVSSW